ncbi:YkgJ family cysteine cluster protein [Pedobacter sp. BAL39]|uniref:YkgJ family cysteine cluster protein n=1 Tax=Pedobacter sp. BAL39 TaxID=391596 RepID=UPI0012FB4309|nr:hypothetical protein [Pedobacter sp. BAL39]
MQQDDRISALCMSCGMCCDGTLFLTAHLRDEVEMAVAASKGFSVLTEGPGFNFELPCHFFKGCCSIYDQYKPKVCNGYFCKPLKKVNNNKLTFEEAELQIRKTLSLRQEIISLASDFAEFKGMQCYKIVDNVKAVLQAGDREAMRRYGKLLLLIIKFEQLLKEIRGIPKKV